MSEPYDRMFGIALLIENIVAVVHERTSLVPVFTQYVKTETCHIFLEWAGISSHDWLVKGGS